MRTDPQSACKNVARKVINIVIICWVVVLKFLSRMRWYIDRVPVPVSCISLPIGSKAPSTCALGSVNTSGIVFLSWPQVQRTFTRINWLSCGQPKPADDLCQPCLCLLLSINAKCWVSAYTE